MEKNNNNKKHFYVPKYKLHEKHRKKTFSILKITNKNDKTPFIIKTINPDIIDKFNSIKHKEGNSLFNRPSNKYYEEDFFR